MQGKTAGFLAKIARGTIITDITLIGQALVLLTFKTRSALTIFIAGLAFLTLPFIADMPLLAISIAVTHRFGSAGAFKTDLFRLAIAVLAARWQAILVHTFGATGTRVQVATFFPLLDALVLQAIKPLGAIVFHLASIDYTFTLQA